MKQLFAFIFGAALGASSVFLYSLYPPVGLVFSISASAIGVWAAGRIW